MLKSPTKERFPRSYKPLFIVFFRLLNVNNIKRGVDMEKRLQICFICLASNDHPVLNTHRKKNHEKI